MDCPNYYLNLSMIGTSLVKMNKSSPLMHEFMFIKLKNAIQWKKEPDAKSAYGILKYFITF